MNKITEYDNFKTKNKNYDVLDVENKIENLEYYWKEVKFKISQEDVTSVKYYIHTMYLVSMYKEAKPERLIRILSQQAKTGGLF